MIRHAKDIDFSPPPRCPTCHVGILPYGRHEPFVVSDDAGVYCRAHGGDIDPTYPERLLAYRRQQMEQRKAALKDLTEDPEDKGNAA